MIEEIKKRLQKIEYIYEKKQKLYDIIKEFSKDTEFVKRNPNIQKFL